MDWAWAWVLISSMLVTRTSRLLGWFFARAVMVGFWAGSRIRLVSCQERERMRGVRSWDILPWPPMRRTRGAMVGCGMGRGMGVFRKV